MTNKTLLIDVGRDVTYVTTINELSHRNAILTKEFYSLNFKDLAEQVMDAYFKEEACLLYIDNAGFGRGLIDELTVQFEKLGYKYDHKNGTVQRESKRVENASPGTFSGVLPAIPPIHTELDKRQKEVIDKYAKEIERLNKELENQQKQINNKVEIYDSLKSLRESYNKVIDAFEME